MYVCVYVCVYCYRDIAGGSSNMKPKTHTQIYNAMKQKSQNKQLATIIKVKQEKQWMSMEASVGNVNEMAGGCWLKPEDFMLQSNWISSQIIHILTNICVDVQIGMIITKLNICGKGILKVSINSR